MEAARSELPAHPKRARDPQAGSSTLYAASFETEAKRTLPKVQIHPSVNDLAGIWGKSKVPMGP
jgi:hypothetical protein